MRLELRFVAATAGILAVVIFLGVRSLYSDEPMYLDKRATYFQTCLDAGERYDVAVESRDGGKSADITYRGQTERVVFVDRFLHTDRYQRDGITMTIDPEISLSGFLDDPDYRCDY